MKSGTITTNNKQESRQYANGINEALLRSEICFWKDMIAGCDPAYPQESFERMQQALALAESRLLTLFMDDPHAYAYGTLNNRPSNVYSILRNDTSQALNPGSGGQRQPDKRSAIRQEINDEEFNCKCLD